MSQISQQRYRWDYIWIALVLAMCMPTISSELIAGETADQTETASKEDDATTSLNGTASAKSEELKSPDLKTQDVASPEIPAKPKPGIITDSADLEAFFDGAVSVQLKAKNIAGGVVAVVADGKVVFTKGYGYAEVETRKKVDPEKTLFRIASVSKLFTWTAVMQQVEEGKLDLDTDINNYLSNIKIPPTYLEPITLKHLMSHTSGFDEFVVGLFSHHSQGDRPLYEILRQQMPSRIRAPGLIPSYSNYGSAIAGHAVACVSGQTWEDYVEKRILNPLKMEHTLVRQPDMAKLPADLSQGYVWEAGEFQLKPFEYVPATPIGGISTSASDAAKFMIAHLKDGALGEERIMTPETARRMREPLFRPDPKTDAICHGFMEMTLNGERLLGHDGATICFHSQMELLPDRGIGIFTSFNTNTSEPANREILFAFLDRYFPVANAQRPKANLGFKERAKQLIGEYLPTRYSHKSVAKLAALLGAIQVSSSTDDETLIIRANGQARRFVEVEPLVFHERDGRGKFVFQKGKNGQIDALYPMNLPVVSALRPEWKDSPFFHVSLLLACLAIFTSAFLYWPVIAFSVDGWNAFSIRNADVRGHLTALGWMTSFVCIGFFVCLMIVLNDPTEIVFGISPNLKLLLFVPMACAILAALNTIGCLFVWIHGFWYFPERLHFTLVTLAGIAFTWLLYYWNFLTLGS